MKILFVQLPLIDHGYNYIGGNVPYASAALTAYINMNFKEHKAEYLPYNMSNFFSDKNIVKYVLNSGCDTICFSSYLWNIERNLKIAEELKKGKDELKIIFGGPEICQDSFVFSEYRPFIDIFFSGEGEWFFFKYLRAEDNLKISDINGNKLIFQPDGEDVEPDQIFEPFTNNYLNDMPDGSVFLELTRGCPFRCSYCFYSKNSNRIRETDFNIILNTIKEKKNIKEIYILSPTFNGNRFFQERLDKLIELKHSVRLHTELKAEGIDSETAEKIYAAGFRSLEIGIQTLNKSALKKAGRRADTDSEIKGLLNLMKAGIDLKIGIIPGMPEDTPDDFKNTIDILIEKGFGGSVEFYPLMILPGTRIREQVQEYNLDFQNKPPYFLKSSRDFSEYDIIELKEYLEDKTGLYTTISRNPDLTAGSISSFCKGIIINSNLSDLLSAMYLEEIIDTNVFSFIFESSEKTDFSFLKKFFLLLRERDELFNIILKDSILINDMKLYSLLKLSEKDCLYRRIRLYDEWKAGNSIMVYHYIDDFELFKNAENYYNYTEPVFMVTEKNIEILKYNIMNFEEVPSVFVTGRGFQGHSEFFVEYYSDYHDMISFELKDDYRIFIEKTSSEYIDLPFDFRIMKK